MEGLTLTQQWSRRAVLVGIAGSLLAACTTEQAGGIPYSVGVRGDGNHVTLDTELGGYERGTVVSVQSERGIGEATIAWWGRNSPHPLTFHLKLNGLEYFRLAWATSTVTISVNSIDHAVMQWTQGSDKAEVPIAADSPDWLPVQLPSQGDEGYLLRAPPAFVAAAPRLWSIAWVNFFR